MRVAHQRAVVRANGGTSTSGTSQAISMRVSMLALLACGPHQCPEGIGPRPSLQARR